MHSDILFLSGAEPRYDKMKVVGQDLYRTGSLSSSSWSSSDKMSRRSRALEVEVHLLAEGFRGLGLALGTDQRAVTGGQ